MKKVQFLTAFLLCLFINRVFADTTIIKAEIDKQKITISDALTYKLTIAFAEKIIPVPQLPDFKDFSIISQLESSSTSFDKGKMQISVVYVYLLRPKEIGKFTIEPGTVKIKDETYSTESFEVEVIEGEFQPEPPQEQKPSLPEKQKPDRGREKIIL